MLTPALPAGVNQVVAVIRDLGGNEATSATSFNVDTERPSLVIGEPQPGSRYGTSAVQATVQYGDDQGLDLASFRASVDGQPVVLSQGPGSASGEIAASDGPHSLSVSISDRAGNQAAASVSFSVDTMAPQVAVVQPAPGAIIATASPHARVTFDDARGVDLATLRIAVNGADRTSQFQAAAGVAQAELAGLPAASR